MTDLTLLESIDEIITFLENQKSDILESNDQNIIETPALIGLENYILHKGSQKIQEKNTSKEETEKNTYFNRIGSQIFLRAAKAIIKNNEKIQSLSPKEQIKLISSQVEVYDDHTINEMRKVASLNDEHHEGLKSATNIMAGNYLINLFVQETQNKNSKVFRDQLFDISDKATKFSEKLDQAIISQASIILGLSLGSPTKIEEIFDSNPTLQLLRMIRASEDLSNLGQLRAELNDGELGPYFTSRNAGDQPDTATQLFIEELWDYLVNVVKVKPTASREAGNSVVIEIALRKLNLEITSSKIYSRIRKIQKATSKINL